MAIAYGGAGTGGGGANPTSGSWSLTGATWNPGDLAVVWFMCRNSLVTITEDASITQKRDDNLTGARLFVGYRVLQSGDTTFGWTATSSANNDKVWGIDVFSGVDTSGDPFEANATPANGTGVNPNPPAVTVVTAGAAVYTVVVKNNDMGGSFTPPTNYTLGSTQDSTAGSDSGGGIAYRLGLSAGSEDPGTWTVGGSVGDTWNTWTGALKPAAAAAAFVPKVILL